MIPEHDPILELLRQSQTEPLAMERRVRVLAIARTNLTPQGKERRLRRLILFLPPASLVPSLLVSAALVFVLDAFIRIFHLLRQS